MDRSALVARLLDAQLDPPAAEAHFDAEYYDERVALSRAIAHCLAEFESAARITSNASVDELIGRFTDTSLSHEPIPAADYGEFLRTSVLPHAVNVGHERFFGHMTSPLPSFQPELARLVTSLNQNVVKVETSKVFTLLERQVLAKLHRLVFARLPSFYETTLGRADRRLGVTTSGGTLSNITALWLARNTALGMDDGSSMMKALRQRGYSDAVLVGSRLAHYSLNKAASMLGLGTNNVLEVSVNPQGRMDLADLEDTLDRCRDRRELVVAVVGLAGSTETGSIDELDAIARRVQRRGIHFHVDAAWGGPLLFSTKHRDLLRGIDRADTVSMCGHKQLYLPQGMSVLLCRDPSALETIRFTSRYQAREGSWDLGSASAEGSRGPQCLYLHAALALLGVRGYAELVDASLKRARDFAELVDASPAFELMERPQTNVVIYRFLPAGLRGAGAGRIHTELETLNRLNTSVQKAQFREGHSFASRTTISHGHHGGEPAVVLRAVLANPRTDFAAMRATLAEQAALGDRIAAAP